MPIFCSPLLGDSRRDFFNVALGDVADNLIQVQFNNIKKWEEI